MEAKIQTFLTLVAWVAALYATVTVFRRLKLQGYYIERGRSHITVPWPAIIAAAAWLWLIAGWIL